MKRERFTPKIGERIAYSWERHAQAGWITRLNYHWYQAEPYAPRVARDYRPRFRTWREAADFLRFHVEQRDIGLLACTECGHPRVP